MLTEQRKIGELSGRHSFARALLFPIYSREQLLFVVWVFVLPMGGLALLEPKLAAYVSVGAWIGLIVSMLPSQPTIVYLDCSCKGRVIEMLRSAGFREIRTGAWRSGAHRFWRWKSDDIELMEWGHILEVRGRRRDLMIIASKVRLSSAGTHEDHA